MPTAIASADAPITFPSKKSRCHLRCGLKPIEAKLRRSSIRAEIADAITAAARLLRLPTKREIRPLRLRDSEAIGSATKKLRDGKSVVKTLVRAISREAAS